MLKYRDFHRDYLGILALLTERNACDGIPLGRHPNVRVALQHGSAHVTHQGEHGGFRDAVLREPRGESMPEVMKAARDARGLS